MEGWVAMARHGFTLIELLIVIVIIVLVSVLTIPMILPAWSHRQVSEGARILQGSLVGARDAAIRDNSPQGIRLLPDPAFPLVRLANGQLDPSQPLVASRIIPLSLAPSYTEGRLNQWTGPLPAAVAGLPYPGPGVPGVTNPNYGQTTALMVWESPVDPQTGLPNSPTSWFWNIRLGDKLQIGGAGKFYWVVGPMSITPAGVMINGTFYANNEMFVNVGPPGTPSPLTTMLPGGQVVAVEFLLLVNGVDDNHDGYVDGGWDGVDNDGINGVDDIGEWIEQEAW
jgi:prepilin-type N-terminal cleavage/methylation domain-containing protein